ncbi:diguanylate cyclase (GGDEF)-like protein [Duganella sp. 3397]|uniref:diguanylate cyclase domain-containing protein n=1 Tax=Duganella sp. 3397 TaxID=2817732 RepID=UPI00285696FD|nr:diguanylate cyclase [Duganella sp. 3397]MDR7049238.1 diguanylate cyclase (GGDEF)-like protein [Duganella sp. 3397]
MYTRRPPPNFLLPLLAVLSLLLLLALSAKAHAAGAPVEVRALHQGVVSLTDAVAVLEDPGHALDLAQARAQSYRYSGQADQAISFGYSRSAYWLKVELRNSGAAPVRRLLEISNARLSDITFYEPDEDGSYRAHHTGSAMPYASRDYPNRYYVYQIELPARSQHTYYLRVASEGAKLIPLRLWEPQAFAVHAQGDYLAQGIFFGMVIAMMLFNLVLFAMLRDRLYLMYVVFVVVTAMGLAAQNGLGHEWLWPAVGGRWPNLSAAILFSLSHATLTMFMRRMIGTRTLVPWLDKLLLAMVAWFLVSPVLLVLFYQQVAGAITTIWSITSPLTLVIALVCVWRRQRSAYYFSAAFCVLLVGNMGSALAALAILPHNLGTNFGAQIGSACEMLLLAFALADRMHVMRREKEQAQAMALAAQNDLITGLKLSEQRLEAHVAQRTAELQQANNSLALMSMTDVLTGIPNRRRFDQILAAEWTRAARQHSLLAIGMLDIDHFKKYNDHYGHQQGDDCLRRVAAAIDDQFRRGGDQVARYGGEEFIFIVPDAQPDTAMALAQAVCAAVAALGIVHAAAPGGIVTVSVGVACGQPVGGEEPEQLVHAADVALYQAKKSGRNRAMLA